MKYKVLLSSLLISSTLLTACSSENVQKKEENNNKQNQKKETSQPQNKNIKTENDKQIEKKNRDHFKNNKAQFETGITYEQIAREPDLYKNKNVKFTGKVLQIVKNELYTTLRVAVNGNYKNVILVTYLDGATEKNLLQDDNITLYGVFKGEDSYTATSGAKITLPQITALYIELNQ